MKKALSLLVLLALFNACDDGDLTQEDISFEDITQTQSCTNSSTNSLIYKLKDQEALLLEIPTATFSTELTEANDTLNLNISTTTNRVVYRFYNGTVATANICETIAPATPIITDQWVATDGQIRIVTTPTKTTDATTNRTKITGYNHNIVLKNVTFAKASGTQVYETFPFGNYSSTATNLPFNFTTTTIEKCTSSNDLYKFNTNEALILTIDPALIVNEVTPLNTPRIGYVGTTANKLTYRLFTGTTLTSAYFCNTTTPTTPTLSQEWNGVTGNANSQTGIIEVTTTTNGPNSFKHTIVLKKVSFKKGAVDFTLGDSYPLGELFTLSN
ncbi:hypothetical protein [Flavobacterium seoulense]|uniref:Lipoprotein n=1 Tax=Flavobacterium seoulense TaxID=1492738 RepID=A0A066WX81_9FLAO|nr:hypothetical protein [Flavobacterium seoulense]KDN55549.1 hypothetical protein FEM21_14320 [Flavobacterium seoulense]